MIVATVQKDILLPAVGAERVNKKIFQTSAHLLSWWTTMKKRTTMKRNKSSFNNNTITNTNANTNTIWWSRSRTTTTGMYHPYSMMVPPFIIPHAPQVIQ